MHPIPTTLPDIHDPHAATRLGRARLAIGLCQGVLLYLLDAARKAGRLSAADEKFLATLS